MTQPPIKQLPVKAERRAPFLKSLRLSVVGQNADVALVSILGLARDPLAVVGRVGAVVVSAFNCVRGRWARTHVGVEVLERVAPAVTHGYTPAAVVFVVLAGLPVAPVFDLAPRSVFRAFGHSVGPVGITRMPLASATFCVPIAETSARNDLYASAIAHATPCGLSIGGSDAFGNNEEPKPLSGVIDSNRAAHSAILPAGCA